MNKNVTLYKKLRVYFSIFVIIPTMIIGIFASIISITTTRRMAIELNREMLERVSLDIDSLVYDTKQLCLMTANDLEVQEILRKEFQSMGEVNYYSNKGNSRLSAIFSQNVDIFGLYVIGKNGCVFKSRFYSVKNEVLNETDWYEQIILGNSNKIEWLAKHEGSFVVETLDESLISGGFPIIDKASGKKCGIILFDIKEETFESMLQPNFSSENGGMMLLDEENNRISYTKTMDDKLDFAKIVDKLNKEKENTGLDIFTSSGYLIMSTVMEHTNWKVLAMIPMNVIYGQGVIIGAAIFITLLVVCTCALFIAMKLSLSVSQPVKELRSAMQEVEEGRWNVRVQRISEDEFGQLATGFNNMISHIKRLMNQQIQEQKKLRKAEITALQAQINPHFLYNTLDSVIWMARKGDTEGVERMVDALTKLFRISLSKGQDVICVSEEIEHVRNYLEIQKMRYPLEYCIDLDERICNEYIIKLILQPLAENAIYHGTKLKEGKGRILIKAYEENGNLIFEVGDNGKGMLPDRLEEVINLEKPDAGSYGLRNINQKIKIYYGEEYGIHFESEYLMGTTVTISLPKRMEDERKNG